jgi:hypothetical protein
MASMYVVAAFAVAYAAMRHSSRGPAFLAAVFVAVVLVCELVGLGGEIAFLGHTGNLAFGVALAAALWLESRIAGQGVVTLDTRWAWAAAGSLLVALAVWSTAKEGSPLCSPTSLYQGHGVWHLLCAVSAWCLFRLYVSERPLSRYDGYPAAHVGDARGG